MVTSADGGEGKTLLSCHLAVSMARAGYRTLLMDCDLRRPAIHKILDLVPKPGLCELMRGEIDATAAIQKGPVDGLWVVAAGQTDVIALRALAQQRCRDWFKKFKEQYDFVIVDSAPVLPVADSLQIGQCVDGVILSILRNVSRLPAVFAAYERLATLRVHILGAVVNGVDSDYYRIRYPFQAEAAAAPASDEKTEPAAQ